MRLFHLFMDKQILEMHLSYAVKYLIVQVGEWYFHRPVLCAWVKVFRINPDFRILMDFYENSASKYWIKEIIISSLISFQII